MKKYGNIYEKIHDIENLRTAYKKARSGKTDYKEVQEIDKNPDRYLKEIQKMLEDKTFTTSEYKAFKKTDSGKERIIYKLPFYPDRIIQWAIMLQIETILVNRIPEFSCASIPKRGINKASSLIRRYIKETPGAWYLQLDIKKFFPSIQHKYPKLILESIFKDRDLLNLLFDIIDSIPGGVGIPIGNYTSQYFANLTLVPFLQYAKHKLKIKKMVVYMDDIVIIGENKSQLENWLESIEGFLWDELNLKIKPNYKIGKITQTNGIDFVGFVHYETHTFLRKSIKTKMIKKTNKIHNKIKKGNQLQLSDICSFYSYKGWLGNCDGGSLYFKYMSDIEKSLIKRSVEL